MHAVGSPPHHPDFRHKGDWVPVQGFDGMMILNTLLAEYKCGPIHVLHATQLCGNMEALVTWYVEDANQEQNELWGATAASISRTCGPTFSEVLRSIDHEAKRKEKLCEWFQDRSSHFFRLLPGAATAWGENAVGWESPLFQSIVQIYRLKKSQRPQETKVPQEQVHQRYRYIPKSHLPSNGPILAISLLELPNNDYVLRVKKNLKVTKHKVIKTAFRYSDGQALVRIGPNPLSEDGSSIWDAELNAQTKIKKTNDDLAQSGGLKRILVPLAIAYFAHGVFCKKDPSKLRREIILPYYPKNGEEYFKELAAKKQTLSEENKNALMLGFAEGIYELHKLVQLSHHDLKLTNFMISVDSAGNGNPYPYMIDFGLSGSLEPIEESAMRGSDGWLPPEAVKFLLKRQEGDRVALDPVKWDAWGLYVLMLSTEEGRESHLCALQKMNSEKFLARVKELNTEPMPPPYTRDWVKRCLGKENPAERMTPTEAFQLLKKILVESREGCSVS